MVHRHESVCASGPPVVRGPAVQIVSQRGGARRIVEHLDQAYNVAEPGQTRRDLSLWRLRQGTPRPDPPQ